MFARMLRKFRNNDHTQPFNSYEVGYNEGRYGGFANPPVSLFGSVDDQYMKGFYRGKGYRNR